MNDDDWEPEWGPAVTVLDLFDLTGATQSPTADPYDLLLGLEQAPEPDEATPSTPVSTRELVASPA